MSKFDRLIEMCENGVALNEANVGDDMIFINRGSFQLIIPKEGNTDDHGDFFVYSINGHDCYSYNSESTHVYRIIDGNGIFIIDNETIDVKPGDVVTIEPNKVFTYMGNMILTFEMMPNFKDENDHFVEKVEYDQMGQKKL